MAAAAAASGSWSGCSELCGISREPQGFSILFRLACGSRPRAPGRASSPTLSQTPRASEVPKQWWAVKIHAVAVVGLCHPLGTAQLLLEGGGAAMGTWLLSASCFPKNSPRMALGSGNCPMSSEADGSKDWGAPACPCHPFLGDTPCREDTGTRQVR